MGKVNFYAYGTLRYGANVAAGDLDADGMDEIVTGAGPGAPFGPHVRAFNYDGIGVTAMHAFSFFAYATPRFGVEVAAGDVSGDGHADILTGPGPSAAFAPQLRGFSGRGAPVPLPGCSGFAFSGSRHGLNPASGDLDGDGRGEITCGAGPDSTFGSRMRSFRYDGAALAEVPFLSIDVYGLGWGVRVAAGPIGY